MIVRKDRKILRQGLAKTHIKCGHGYKKYRIDGDGIMDYVKPVIDFISNNKDVIQNVGESAVNTMRIGKNAKDIIDSIRSKTKNKDEDQNDLKSVIDKINKLRIKGSGFAYI
jgi:hypothetical protein